MALVSCKECGKKISSSTKTCPHCGKKQNGTNWKGILYIVGVVYTVGFINYLINGTPEKETPKTYKISPSTELKKTLKGGYFACTSKSKFSEMSMATVNQDSKQIGYLLSNGCVLTKSGVGFSYIGVAGFGVVKIRAYDGGGSIILYTNHENVRY